MNKTNRAIKNTAMKIEMYIISLWLFFVLAIIATADISIFFSKTSLWSDWTKLLRMNVIPLICIGFLILCVVFFQQFKYKLEGAMQLPIKLTTVKNINCEYLSFLITYIFPLVLVDFKEPRQVMILSILIIIMGIIYVKTNMFYSNPTLALLNYRIYEVDTESVGLNGVFISFDEIRPGQKVKYIRLDTNVFFVRRTD